MVGQLVIIDRTGHTTVEYDTETGEGVEEAIRQFNEQVERYGARAFDTSKKPGEPISTKGFKPEEYSEVTVVPPMAGGS